MKCNHVRYTKSDKKVYNRGVASTLPVVIGKYMGLRNEAISLESVAFIDDLAVRFHTGKHAKPSKKTVIAIGAVVADLLRIAGRGPNAYAYRDMSNSSFTDEAAGARCVRAALDGLKDHNLIRWRSGKKAVAGMSTQGDRASQFYIETGLLDSAAAYGITPANWPSHFRQRPRPKVMPNAVQLRKSRSTEWYERSKRGEKMQVNKLHPQVIDSGTKVNDINRAYFDADIKIMLEAEGDFSECHYGFVRIFCRGDLVGYDYNKGGRIYSDRGGYQNATKTERASMLINGDSTVEIDIRGCQLAILHAKLGRPLDPDVDPYHGIGTDRDVAKACVMQILGSSKLPCKWSAETARRYGKENGGSCLRCDHPFKEVLSAVLEQFPIFRHWKDSKVRWDDLQYADSEVMLEAVHRLATVYNIIALPVHDSLIIPCQHESVARKVLSDVFTNTIGVRPYIK